MISNMTREEYEEKRRRLEADAADAKKTLNRARAAYDGLCDELRNLRVDWQEQQKALLAQPAKRIETAGLVTKTSVYPCRIKPFRGRHTHAAAYRLGSLFLTTACNQEKGEDSVDHLDEDAPITCPACQRNT